MTELKILSDPICPWCYIGKTGLDKAMKHFPSEILNIIWLPFQLNPDMPKEGMERNSYLSLKFGSSTKATNAYKPIADRLKNDKINCNLSKIKTTPNTLNAQRLIYWAGIEGCQTEVVENLFEAYFLYGSDIGDIDSLIQLGKKSGLSGDLTKRLLESLEDQETIHEIEMQYRKAGIEGVPTFILNNDFVISGAQNEEFWIKVLTEILNKNRILD
jgi:predicted DsbA family dithiol-disulfide isomerase